MARARGAGRAGPEAELTRGGQGRSSRAHGQLELENLGAIAEGGEGRVWLCRDRAAGGLYALKVVPLPSAGLARFVECACDPALRDPEGAVVVPLEAGDARRPPPGIAPALPTNLPGGGDVAYLLTRYVHGPNALELCDCASRWGAAETVAVLGPLFAALARLHARGRAHLDVKPENLLVDPTGQLFLADALAPGGLGTPPYAAPELALAPGPCCDVFAAGAVGHVLLARSFPKPGEPPALPELPEPDVALAPEERAGILDLHRLLRACLARDPAARPFAADAAARLRDLGSRLSDSCAEELLEDVQESYRKTARLELLGKAIAAVRGSFAPSRRRRRFRARALVLPGVGAICALGVWVQFARLCSRPAGRSDRPLERAVAAHVMGPGERFAPGHGLFQIEVVAPARRLSVAMRDGPVVWTDAAPAAGEIVKLDLPPGVYLFDEVHAHGEPESRQFTIAPGTERRWETTPYRENAPKAP